MNRESLDLPVPASEAQPLVLEQAPAPDDILWSPHSYKHAMELATTLSKSQLLPATFRGKPEDVFMAIMLARKMGEDVFTILSNVHFVNGKPGWSAPFLIARANASGVFDGELSWQTTGEGAKLAVTCSAILKKTGQRVSKTVSLEMARADGWTKNNKYSSIPEQMLSYRAATFLIRLYCPAVLYGLHTSDEWEDVAAARGQPISASYEEPEPSPSSSSSNRHAATPGAQQGVVSRRSEGDPPLPPSPSVSAGSGSPGRAASACAAASGTVGTLSAEAPLGEAPATHPEPASPGGGFDPHPSSLSLTAPPEGEAFESAQAAQEWALLLGVFETAAAAAQAYAQVKDEGHPANAYEMAEMWVAEVKSRLLDQGLETQADRARRLARERRKVETPEQKAERQSGHHPTWQKDRAGFAADLNRLELGADIDSLSAWCEAIGKPTPSHREPGQREQLLKALAGSKAGAAYRAWAEELVPVNGAPGLPPCRVLPEDVDRG